MGNLKIFILHSLLFGEWNLTQSQSLFMKNEKIQHFMVVNQTTVV